MTARFPRSLVAVVITIGASAAGAAMLNCANTQEESTEIPEDSLSGVDNALGLGVLVQASSDPKVASRVVVTINASDAKYTLRPSDKIWVRVRQGKIAADSEDKLNCSELQNGGTLVRNTDVASRSRSGKTVYTKGPEVSAELLDLLHLYDDPNWATGNVSEAKLATARKGPDPIIEACVLGAGNKVRAKLLTTLAFAWDQGNYELGGATSAPPQGLSYKNDGEESSLSRGNWQARRTSEGAYINSQVEYAQLCVQELGEIPFFPKQKKKGRYDTFDCRDFVVNRGDGTTVAAPGVEAAMIPVMRDSQPVTQCDPGLELGKDSNSYACLDNTDSGMYLASGGVQPGPTVVTAKNSKGTHWVLLCRKVADDGNGMTKSKKFNDMAMMGHNPATGKTCFFQNSIGAGTNGAAVPHPADTKLSTTVWSPVLQNYCTGCHGKSGFVHSRWIDGALRANGTPIVPKMGEHPDFPISQNDRPYYVVNQDKQGFDMPKQLVSEAAAPCATCHRVQANQNWLNFSHWSTGTGDTYMSKRSAKGKAFDYAHWMPVRLDGLNETTWAQSDWLTAVKHIEKCANQSVDPECEYADIPRGNNLQAP